MSMISSQCDERLDERLRRAAQTCRELGKHTTANMFLEAADTILELRDDLQRANEAVQDAEHDESMAWDRVRKVEVENAKLRELVLDLYDAIDSVFWDGEVETRERFEPRMSELGIEVTGK